MPGDVIGELTMRVSADIADAERKLGQQLPEDLEKSAQRVRDLQATLGSRTGGEFGDLVATRIDRATRAIELAKTKASELTATLAQLRSEQSALIDFAERAQRGAVTPEEVTQFAPILGGGRLEALAGTERSKGLIEKTEAALGSRLLAISRSQDRLADLLASQLAKTTRTTELAANAVQQDQIRIARGLGQGFARGAGAGLGIPLSFGLAVTGGLIVGQLIGREWQEAQQRLEKLMESLGTLRTESGLTVEGTARIAAAAAEAGVSVDSLGGAIAAIRGKGVAFDEAIEKLRTIEDTNLRAAEAARLFGAEQAKAIAPLIQRGPLAAGADRRAQEFADLQRLDQAGKVLEQRAGGSVFLLSGIARFFQEAGTGAQFFTQKSEAMTEAARKFAAEHPGATAEEVNEAWRAGGDAFEQALRDAAGFADELDRAGNVAEKFSAKQFEGTRALAEMSEKAAAADSALGSLTDRMTAQERAVLGLATSINEEVRTAFDALTSAGALDPDVARALDIAVQAHLDPASTALIVQQLQGIGDFAGSSITDSINKALAGQLTSIAENRLQSLLSVQQQRESIAERIADIEARIADRHQQNAKLAFDFSKAELDQKLRAREDEKAFFAFRDRSSAADTARADARDRREIEKLQEQLAASEKAHPDLARQIEAAEAIRATFDQIADIITGATDVTVNHKLTFSVEGGPVLILDRESARANKDLILGIFGEPFSDLMIQAASGGKRIVENTRPSTSNVQVAGGAVLTP